jgi:patatin-like phospholipase/acyl hydrolase
VYGNTSKSVADGGGVRGLSSLIILKHLMRQVDRDNPPKPCEYFDLIGGTSTGGLIAIMLGRLNMDIDSCIEAYKSLSERAFTPTRARINYLARLIDRFTLRGAYSKDQLAETIRDLVREKTGDHDPDTKLQQDTRGNAEARCKV